MTELELDDIQGYVIRGYAHMQYSRFVLLNFGQPAPAREWLKRIVPALTTAEHFANKAHLPDVNLNIAFTAAGLAQLGITEKNLHCFNPEFRGGMTTEHRSRLLGDKGNSAPRNWDWGRRWDGGPKIWDGTKETDSNPEPEQNKIHAVLMVFGKDEATCMAYYEQLKTVYTGFGITDKRSLDGQTLRNNKEHFGFRDGVSQPVIKGSGKSGPAIDMINPGEFVLGYKNEYDVYPDSPLIAEPQGDMNLLATDAEGSGQKDLGRNSSYLVIRQLEQDVPGFWGFMNDKTRNADGTINAQESLKLAAKFVGRWQSGAPVTKFPDADPGIISNDNDFGYARHDSDGLKCPLGSHLRRCNPRDSFEDIKPERSVTLSNRHRIMRRARLYGDPYEGSPTDTTPNGKVGLIFSCFNADISRQFELVQYTWANSPKVKELYNDPDPIIGVSEDPIDSAQQNFTIQGCPVNTTITGLKRFVTVKGGAYFFFPSITTVRFLTTL